MAFQILGGQLFVRDMENATNTDGKYSYLVCGLITVDKPIETESIHTISVDGWANFVMEHQIETEQELIDKGLTDGFVGKGLDNIMKENIWRLKI